MTDRAPTLDEVVFAHDYPFLHADDGRVYSDRGTWPWSHYLAFANRVTVVSRARPLPAAIPPERLELVSGEGIRFVAAPSLSGARARVANLRDVTRVVDDALASADALVARLPSEIGARAAQRAERVRTPWALEVVSCPWSSFWNYGGWEGRVYAPFSWAQTRRLVRRAPHVLYVTETFLQRRYPTRGTSVACSDVDLPDPTLDTLDRRLARISRGDSPLRIGTIAALTVRFKGVQTALAALAAVRDRMPPFEFRILGAGDPAPWRSLAASLGVEDVTAFDGTLAHGAPVRDWLDRTDVYIQPSLLEGLPRGLTEAMSRACPALGSAVGGIAELLEPQCLHPPRDERALGDLLLRAAGDPEWRRRQAERNFRVAARYTKRRLDAVRAGFWAGFAASAAAGQPRAGRAAPS
jgi:glycosyltransferase involved in cell wall biosynthesis